MRNIMNALSISNIKRIWSGIKRWFSYINVAVSIYDFDYTSILEVEKHQIIRVRDRIAKYDNYDDCNHNIEWINKALACLNIVLEDGCIQLIDNEWKIPYYVNTRNAKRFCKTENYSSIFVLDAIRITKAWILYNKIRAYHLKRWWY